MGFYICDKGNMDDELELFATLQKGPLLGKGSYGSVYLATSNASLSLFAVKSSEFEDSFSLQKERRIYYKLLNCAEAVSCIGHYLSIENGTEVYNLVLEYAPCGTLVDLMHSYGGKIPETHVRFFARKILKGLSWIHNLGIVHCDLKPENILVFPPGGDQLYHQLKIADFGLAKEPEREENACTLTFRGTPWYMSPESVELGQIGNKLDIWSVGCIVIEMLTGKPAFDFSIDQETLLLKLLMYKESPKVPEDLSEEGKDFLMKCLDREPKERWSAGMLLCHPFLLDDRVTNFSLGAVGQRSNLGQISLELSL